MCRDLVLELWAGLEGNGADRPSIGDGRGSALEWTQDDVDEVPEHTKIFFERFEEWGSRTGVPVVAVDFWVEGYDGKDAKYFWKSRIDDKTYLL